MDESTPRRAMRADELAPRPWRRALADGFLRLLLGLRRSRAG